MTDDLPDYAYRVSVITPDGTLIPVTMSGGAVTAINWYVRLRPRIDRGEYHRRQRARVKRKQR